MVYRMGMTILKRRPCMHHRQGRCGRGRPFRDVIPLSIFFILLLRSRGALGRVRATPGAPSAAAARMDGPDGRAGDRPGTGKGLRNIVYHILLFLFYTLVLSLFSWF